MVGAPVPGTVFDNRMPVTGAPAVQGPIPRVATSTHITRLSLLFNLSGLRLVSWFRFVWRSCRCRGGGQGAGRAGPLPGQPDVLCKGAGQAELCVDRDDQPGPPAGRRRVAEPGPGPAQDLLEETERVLEIEAAQERLPGAVQLAGGGAGA